MTRKEAMRQTAEIERLSNHGPAVDVLRVRADYDKLRRIALKIQRHHERECSEESYQGAPAERGERLCIAAENRAIDIISKYDGLMVDFGSGDPRGCSLIVFEEDGQPFEYGRQRVVMAV